MPPTRSGVWRHFIKENETEVKCRLCGKIIKNCKNTTNMMQHLKIKHAHIESYTEPPFTKEKLTKSSDDEDSNNISGTSQMPTSKYSQPDLQSDVSNVQNSAVGGLKRNNEKFEYKITGKKKLNEPLKYTERGINCFKFSKLYSPKMKSVYWRHFGFPTSENDRIITKLSVVCKLCHKVLTNHGNTTNLRAHLQHRHKDIFAKILIETGIQIPPRKSQKKNNNKISKQLKEECELKMDSDVDLNLSGISIDDQSLLYESMVPITYDDDDIIDSELFNQVEVGNNGDKHLDVNPPTLIMKDDRHTKFEFRDVEVARSKKTTIGVEAFQMQDAIVNMIIEDLLNIKTIYEPGMSSFIQLLSGSERLPTKEKIEELVREMHSDKLTTIADYIKIHSRCNPYSLGFELWRNVESKYFISVYFNYVPDAPSYNVVNELYFTFEYNEFTDIDSYFDEFNLDYCTAAIVNYDRFDNLRQFLIIKNIRISLSYDAIMDKCLKSVFNLPEVFPIIQRVKEIILRYTKEIHSKNLEIPVINDDFPWTLYEILKFFAETVSWPDELATTVNITKAITEVLGTLSVTLNTLKSEEIPLSSMLSPITTKIMGKDLATNAKDSALKAQIKETINFELQRHVLEDDNLTIAALLDPRLHRLTYSDNFEKIVQILGKKFAKLREFEGFQIQDTKTTNKNSDKPSKKSNLELFFDIHENGETRNQNTDESRIDDEFKRYRKEVFSNFYESPFAWWNKCGNSYSSLKRLANLYHCVPCAVNMNFKKPLKEQINGYQKRYLLTDNTIESLLFLHYHKN